jgi:outer membrane protein
MSNSTPRRWRATWPACSVSHLKNRVHRTAALAALALAIAGCAGPALGPAPSAAVGPRAVVPPGPPAYDLKAPADSQGGPPAAETQNGPLALTVQDAILATLRNNPSLKVQKYNVPIARTREVDAAAAFDPTLTGGVNINHATVPDNRLRTRDGNTTNNDSINANIGVSQFLPTGTTLSADGTVSFSAHSFYSDTAVVTRGGLSLTQALLRGADVDANLAVLRESELQTKTSQYQLRAFAESLLSDVEQAYWDYAYAHRQMEIVKAAMDVAEKQLVQTNQLIKVQRLAESERAAAEAEVAIRKENVINADGALKQARIHIIQLLTSPERADYTREIELVDKPFTPEGELDDVENHVKIALQRRPEIAQAKLQIQQGELEVVRTRNGLLPRLDLFVTLGKSGYSHAFGGAVEDTFDGPGYDASVGVQGELPLLNRAAKADYRRANLSKEQATESLNNLIQLVQVDVRSAYIEVVRSREQIAATAASRVAQEIKAHVEEEKLKLGKSTSLLVAQAQRDLLNAQIAEVQAVTNHLKALVVLYRLEGTLLDRRYINAPASK